MAAPDATNGAANSLDDLKPPAGVVLPPREIRNILEKTAGYVARNGAVFETRIRDKEVSNPKFSFLNPDDAYNPFYLWRLSEIKEGRSTNVAAGRTGDGAAAEPEKPVGPPKPADFEFSARMPRINQKDLDVIRLTALFVAKNGRQFITQLGQRETGNPQFQFLIPNHTFHNFFQHLVDQYTTLLREGGVSGEGGKQQELRTAELKENVKNKFHILGRARERAEYVKFQEQEKKQKEEEEEEKKAEFARIDWGDFVVVETITFNEADDQADLPPPTNLSELQYASLEDRNKASIGASLRIEEAMPEEDLTSNTYATIPQQQAYNLPVHPGYPTQGQGYQQQHAPAPAAPAEDGRHAQEAAAQYQQPAPQARGGPPQMKIRENYVPRAAQKAANRSTAMAMCPNCKQQIPTDELEAHMRIELLDPSWKEQKAKADQRYATTHISNTDVANNLKRLASQRSDVFDPVTGQAISEEELARRKKAALQSYDGQSDGKNQAQMHHSVNVNEQIRNIHQKFADKR